jgi:mono/diheme cytochrome c family protein
MSRTTRWCAAATAAFALAFAGCGGDDEPPGTGASGDQTETAAPEAAAPETGATGGEQAAQGKELFANTCGGCHTLSDAGTNGEVGPNLDELKPDAERVTAAIESGPGTMPPNLLEGAEAEAVATYVSEAAGN